MASNFKKTILKLLSATDYSVDNLTQDHISSFEHLRHLQPFYEWLSQSLSEANCITPHELEKYKKLQEKGSLKYGEELDEAIQCHLSKEGHSSVPFKESLNDVEQELTLLKEQLHYKQALHQELCSSNAAVGDEIQKLRIKQQKADAEQIKVIKDICATKKTLKDKVSEVQNNISELRDDVLALAQSALNPEVSLDEGIHSLTPETISGKSLSTSLWSISTTSSWQTIRGKDPNINYICQLSFDKYRGIHKQFLKRLTKFLGTLSKVGKSQNNSMGYMDLHLVKERLQKQMFLLMEKESELEGVRAARVKVRELNKTIGTKEFLILTLEREEKEMEDRIEKDSFKSNGVEELSTACKQWAECEALQAVEQKMKEKIEYSKCLIEKTDELLGPLILKLNSDKILHEVLRYEKERIEMSIALYKNFHDSLQNDFYQMEKRIEIMQKNLHDYEQFCALPLEERNDLVEQLASIVLSDKEGVVQAVQHLTDSSRREHETAYEHYILEKNKLISSGDTMEELHKLAMSRNYHSETENSEVINSIQRGLDEMDSGIEEMLNTVPTVINSIANEAKKHKEGVCNGTQREY